MNRRERLPNRRRCEVVETEFRGRQFAILIGRFNDGSIAEVFVEPRKVGSDGAEDSRDCGILLSIALQHGVPLESMRLSVSRAEGKATSLSGHVLDVLAQIGGGA
jgi:hypothetical protein